MREVVADTSILVAAADTRDRQHAKASELVLTHQAAGIIVPATVCVEVDYLLSSRVSTQSARAFLRDVHHGRYILEAVGGELFSSAMLIDEQFADLNVGLVDGSVVATADRWTAEAILSLDGHYRVIAPHIELRPE